MGLIERGAGIEVLRDGVKADFALKWGEMSEMRHDEEERTAKIAKGAEKEVLWFP